MRASSSRDPDLLITVGVLSLHNAREVCSMHRRSHWSACNCLRAWLITVVYLPGDGSGQISSLPDAGNTSRTLFAPTIPHDISRFDIVLGFGRASPIWYSLSLALSFPRTTSRPQTGPCTRSCCQGAVLTFAIIGTLSDFRGRLHSSPHCLPTSGNCVTSHQQ